LVPTGWFPPAYVNLGFQLFNAQGLQGYPKRLTYLHVAEQEESMGKPQDRTVSRRPDGSWANKRNDAEKASSVHDTQADAINAAREMLRNQGGGELTVQGEDHKFRMKDTIPPGNDPKSTPG
jgi:hypothetical protein